MPLANKRAIIIGGGSGIGLEVARQAIAQDAHVVIGGRNEARLATALSELGSCASAHPVDTSDKPSIRAFFDRVGAFDHLFISAASYTLGPIDQISDEDAESPFRSKFWGQYWTVRDALPYLAPDGSITLDGRCGRRAADQGHSSLCRLQQRDRGAGARIGGRPVAHPRELHIARHHRRPFMEAAPCRNP